ANDELDLRAESTRRACAQEEHHLRQLLQIGPDIVTMARPLADALELARDRDVTLSIRTGSVDVPDPEAAQRLGALIESVVRGAGTGAQVTVSLTQGVDGPHVRLLHPRDVVAPDVGDLVPLGWTMSTVDVGSQQLLELT